MARHRSWGALLLAGLCGVVLTAAAPSPSLKPPAPVSPYVTPTDEAVLRAVFTALTDRRYAEAERRRRDLEDPLARAVADWAYLRSGGPGIRAAEVAAFLSAHPDWPDATRIQAQAEDRFDDETPAADLLLFFDTRDPVRGEGMVQLGRALIESGSVEAGEDMIRRAWIERDWTAASERQILSRHGARLREADHVAKADRQLFDIEATATERLLPLLPKDERRAAEARIALLKRDRNGPGLYEALPEEKRLDAGVLHAAVRYWRRSDKDLRATELAGLAPQGAEALRDPDAWYTERSLLARTALSEGRFEDAYVLSAYSGLTRGADFAEAEFLAGWIALRFLGDPQRAETHFALLASNVSSPISLSRGEYWLARAKEAGGDEIGAVEAFRQAASRPFTYYGQLAAERLGDSAPRIAFPEAEAPNAEDLASFEARPMAGAMRILAEVGEDWAFDRFARALDDSLETPGEVLAFADLVTGERKTHLAVRAGKVARSNGAATPQATYPLLPVPEAAAGFVETPLILGLSRQESEFNPRIVSSARAQGVMQLLTGTAKITARKEGLPYEASRLLDDPAYNMTLGAAHLSHLIERFGGSYVMTIAGYNAGPHRVDGWTERFGDPREPSVDPVDWVELIPFSETRNYVQRVLENVQIYRARLDGGVIAGRLTGDLVRGGSAPGAIGKASPAPALVRYAEAEGMTNVLSLPAVPPYAVTAYGAAAEGATN
ncbi:lytic transglycosylase domain-containing protein [Parvularcula dongshanensis]|uniref:Soluble lytic murein transglycosylase n=1 Tax=Parvularcula dongshanensis TaxID=1173995 RepID=A0A840I4Z8_9PROT|nr:lytic transglycosylase domain-containing protein [Parvularcula dongshanensis]MBB4659442.1 soluble lytic murein transglycosylase [Parvularcula dongshanensis]